MCGVESLMRLLRLREREGHSCVCVRSSTVCARSVCVMVVVGVLRRKPLNSRVTARGLRENRPSFSSSYVKGHHLIPRYQLPVVRARVEQSKHAIPGNMPEYLAESHFAQPGNVHASLHRVFTKCVSTDISRRQKEWVMPGMHAVLN
jgi:hypothetical protein